MILVPGLASSQWLCQHNVVRPALHNVMTSPDLLFGQSAQHGCVAGNESKPRQHHVVNPLDEATLPNIPTRLAAWRCMTNSLWCSSFIPETIGKYSKIKRKTVIQCLCLRWDTCYCLDMIQKTEIRRDAQENGLVFCVCITELLLPFLFSALLFQIHRTEVIRRHWVMRSILASAPHAQHYRWS